MQKCTCMLLFFTCNSSWFKPTHWNRWGNFTSIFIWLPLLTVCMFPVVGGLSLSPTVGRLSVEGSCSSQLTNFLENHTTRWCLRGVPFHVWTPCEIICYCLKWTKKFNSRNILILYNEKKASFLFFTCNSSWFKPTHWNRWGNFTSIFIWLPLLTASWFNNSVSPFHFLQSCKRFQIAAIS